MFYAAVTISELPSSTTWVYLHPVDRRFQLSPVPEPIASREDADLALTLALNFYDSLDVPYARYGSLTGPDGPIRDSYHGPKAPAVRLSLEHTHNQALARLT